MVFLDTAKVYHGNIDDMELKVSFLEEKRKRTKKFQLNKFHHIKVSDIYVIDFKRHIENKIWINLDESTQVRFSITNYVKHLTELKLIVMEF